MTEQFRTESDFMGEFQVHIGAKFGTSTARANEHFPISILSIFIGFKNYDKSDKIAYKSDIDQYVEASVEGTFVLERLAKGNVTVRWFVKKIDYQTPMYNDTVSYREV